MSTRTLVETEQNKGLAAPIALASTLFALRTGMRAALLLLAPALIFIFFSQFFAQTDPDYWWHVRTGQLIYENGAVPRADMFSYTVEGQIWVAHEWLTELLFYLVHHWFGYVGNVALFGGINALTWLVVYITCRRWGIGELGAAMLMTWGFAMSIGSTANVRPQTLTALFIAITALLLTRYRQGERRALWPLPLLMALWVNLHGGYVIGLALLGVTIVGEALAQRLRQPAVNLKPLLVAATLSAVATLLNPHGVEALLYPFTYAGTQNASMQYIAEWQSPNFHSSSFLLFGAGLLLVIVVGVSRRPLSITEALWTLAFAIMALQSVRHIPLYAVVVMPLLGGRLQAELPALRNSLAAWRRPTLLAAVIWLALIASVMAIVVPAERRSTLQLGREPGAANYPVGAVEYLRAHGLEGNLFNEYVWGGYLIYQLYPERQVFIDGRADVYGDAFIEKYMAVQRLRPNWREVLDEHDVRLALVAKDGPLASALSIDGDWRESYAGKVERLFVRQTP